LSVQASNKSKQMKEGINQQQLQPLLIDSGATSHILNDKTNFISFDKNFIPEEHYVELADGTRVKNASIAKGTAVVEIRDNKGRLCRAELQNVQYAPSFPFNIISVNAATATNKGAIFLFGADSGSLCTGNGTSFPILRKDKFYFLNLLQSQVSSTTVSPTSFSMSARCDISFDNTLDTTFDTNVFDTVPDYFNTDISTSNNDMAIKGQPTSYADIVKSAPVGH